MSRFKCRFRYFVVGAAGERLLSQWVTTIMIVVHWGLGLSIIIGGKQRFTVPTYQPLIDIAHGHVWLWGVSVMLAGLLMTAPLKWPNVAGLWIGMVWMIMWTSLFTVSLVQYPAAAATPVVAYAGFALINTALLTARLLERPRED